MQGRRRRALDPAGRGAAALLLFYVRVPNDANATLAASLSGRGIVSVDGAAVFSDGLDAGVLLRAEGTARVALRGGAWHAGLLKTTTHFGARRWGAWAALLREQGGGPLVGAEVSACGPQAGTGGMCP